jgi:hypothetical protein
LTIPKELEAKILRYFHVEKWKVGTISRQLGLHHSLKGSEPLMPVS